MINNILINFRKIMLMLTACFTVFLFACPSHSAEVIILGNTKLKPVSDVVRRIQETLPYGTIVKSPADIKDDLEDTVRKEGAKAVIALGKDAVSISSALPESIPVIYGLIINPLKTERQNITGVYMTTPVSEYISFLNRYFPAIEKIGVICAYEKKEFFDHTLKTPKVKFCNAKNPYEFIEGINSLGNDVDALLLLPEKDLITAKTLEQLYLYSFKEKIPVIGISEKYVKIGSLFSLGFDTTSMGKQIGELAKKVVLQGSAAGIPQSPPDRFNLYINNKTAESMNIKIPQNILSLSKKIYR